MFDPTKPYQTRGGQQANIVYTFKNGQYLVIVGDGYWVVYPDGWFWKKSGDLRDLINIPIEYEGYVNWYKTTQGIGMGYIHKTRADADQAAENSRGNPRIACVYLKFPEGEGLN